MRRDIATLPKAFRIFWKLTRLHLALDRGLSKADISRLVYLRVIEITAGRKNDGHAHMHVYLICPYLYSPILRMHWAKAIETCGYDLSARSAPTPLADVLAQVVEDWRRAELQRLLLTRRNGEPVLEVPNPVIDIEKCYEGFDEVLTHNGVCAHARCTRSSAGRARPDQSSGIRLAPVRSGTIRSRGQTVPEPIEATRTKGSA